jgi:hypothetical protein
LVEKAGKTRQVRRTETNASEPPMKHRKCIDGVETVVLAKTRDKLGRGLMTGRAASGVKAA